MINLVNDIDLFSFKPSILFNKKKSIGSLYGFILTIIASTSAIVIGSYFLLECIDRERFRLTSSNVSIPSKTYYTLENITAAFNIKDGSPMAFPQFERYFTLDYRYNTLKKTELAKCKLSSLGFDNNINGTDSFCLPQRNINTTTYGAGFRTSIIVSPCVNETDKMIAESPVSSDIKTYEERKNPKMLYIIK